MEKRGKAQEASTVNFGVPKALLPNIHQQYMDQLVASRVDHSKQEIRTEIADTWLGEAFSEFVKRHFGVSELEHLSVTELMELEKLIPAALSQIRSSKVCLLNSVRKTSITQCILHHAEQKKYFRLYGEHLFEYSNYD
ncbi:MADS-box transcription factor [Medicago truncatula]|uniref:MADS-box transcription factor n=1 Tax=Medicago truncatula TaxID=3880 RepID=G7LHA1_MEDTR|nr:MADS-box transcription factor [Medicago truncatula]